MAGSWSNPITGTPMFKVVHRLKRLKGVLKKFNAEGFQDLQAKAMKQAQILKHCQEQVHRQPGNMMLRRQELEAAIEYKNAQQIYMQFLQQKAKGDWLRDGDLNTKVFHRSIKKRQL